MLRPTAPEPVRELLWCTLYGDMREQSKNSIIKNGGMLCLLWAMPP
ncbi:hypothetical protein [Acetobacter ascendens]|nr:hypothetical protein [Acetobacter ascendens]